MTAGRASPEVARRALPRDVSAFLIQLAICRHKQAAYPPEHPSLTAALDAALARLKQALHERPKLVLGIAEDQLLISGSVTDPANAVLRELARALHRARLGAIRFARGVSRIELEDLLRSLARSAQPGAVPLGLQPQADLSRWPHIQLYPHTYDQLRLADLENDGTGLPEDAAGRGRDGGRGRAVQLWMALAATAREREVEQLEETDATPAAVAEAINRKKRDTTYDRVIVDYLLQINQEIGGQDDADAEAVRRQLAELLTSLDGAALRQLLEAGGDPSMLSSLALDAVRTIPLQSVVALLQSAAQANEAGVSDLMLRLLRKLSAQAEGGAAPIRPQAEAAVRETVRRLIEDWTLSDPNPAAHTAILDRIAYDAREEADQHPVMSDDPLRIVQMALETDTPGVAVWDAADLMVDRGQIGDLLEVVEQAETGSAVVHAFWDHLATPAAVHHLIQSEEADPAAARRLITRIGLRAAEPMLEALELSESRTARRRLLTWLGELGEAVGPLAVRRMPGAPWYVQRNMLTLLQQLPQLPAGFEPGPWARHADARVRREALKLLLHDPLTRDEGIMLGLTDEDDTNLGLVLNAGAAGLPRKAMARLRTLLDTRPGEPGLRVAMIRLLQQVADPWAREWLVRSALRRRRWFRAPRLEDKSPDLLEILTVLNEAWSSDPSAQEPLRLARRSRDPEIREAAGAPESA